MAVVISIVPYPFLPAKVGGQKGVAIFNKYFSKHLPFICITTENNDPNAAEGYEVRNVLSNSKFRYINFFYFFLFRKIIKKEKATHLLIEHPYFGWLGILLKWFCGVKLIVHSHNLEGLRWKSLNKWWWKILWHYEKMTHRKADYNFFIQKQDMDYAVLHFGLKENKCLVVTYGIEQKNIPTKTDKEHCRNLIQKLHGIKEDEKILFFNGAFNYLPNIDGLMKVVDIINPPLAMNNAFKYKFLICGQDIPISISSKAYPNIIFAGFVDDIVVYFKAADIFINPISMGGGIKTKLVEALSYNVSCVSTEDGAFGVSQNICGGKIKIIPNNDWESFVKAVFSIDNNTITPPAFYDFFYWENIASRAANFVQKNLITHSNTSIAGENPK